MCIRWESVGEADASRKYGRSHFPWMESKARKLTWAFGEIGKLDENCTCWEEQAISDRLTSFLSKCADLLAELRSAKLGSLTYESKNFDDRMKNLKYFKSLKMICNKLSWIDINGWAMVAHFNIRPNRLNAVDTLLSRPASSDFHEYEGSWWRVG